jgi:hypothetical protein
MENSRGCTEVCVIGHLAGHCHLRGKYDQTQSGTTRPDRSFARRLPETEDLIGENGILKQLTKAIVERVLQAELAAHVATTA